MALVPRVKDGDWNSVRRALQQLQSSTKLGPLSSPTFAGLTLSGLTANSLIYTNASNLLTSAAVGTGLSFSPPNLTTNDSEIVHDNLSGFVANEHIDHTTVSISAGGILSGGGDISANRTISLTHSDVDHNQTTNFVANEHIDHTSVSISAGGILSGGGDISANRTISLAHGDVDHDQTANFVADKHVAHSGVILTAGDGLTGGGDISASRSFALDTTYSPTFAGMTLSNLTANRLVASDGSKALISSDLAFWIAGTTNRVTVTDDGDGSVTLSLPQDIHAGAFVQFSRVGVGTSPTPRLHVLHDADGQIAKFAIYEGGEEVSFNIYGYTSDYGTAYLQNTIMFYLAAANTGLKFAAPNSNAEMTWNIGGYNSTASERMKLSSSSFDINVNLKGYVGAKIGDGGITNYTEFKSDGEVNLHGTARVKQGIWVDANGIKAPGAKPATEISHGDLEIAAWQFANEGVAANQQSVSWSCRIPEPMDRTVAPTVSIGWSADGVSPGNCEWQLEYFWTGPDDDTTQVAEETLTQTTAASVTANGMVLTTFTGINAPDASDICMHCRLTRLSASANDTINDTVELHGACLQYTCDKLGEAT